MTTKLWDRKFLALATVTAIAAFFAVWLALSNVAAQIPEGNGISDAAVSGDEGVAGAVPVGGLWQTISVLTGVGSFAKGCLPNDPGGAGCVLGAGAESATAPPWTFSGATILKVTDAFAVGDRFEVFDNNVSIGSTSVPVGGSPGCGNDPDPCFADTNFSSGTFVLGAGAHSITIKLIAGLSSGAYYFRVDVDSSEPHAALEAKADRLEQKADQLERKIDTHDGDIAQAHSSLSEAVFNLERKADTHALQSGGIDPELRALVAELFAAIDKLEKKLDVMEKKADALAASVSSLPSHPDNNQGNPQGPKK